MGPLIPSSVGGTPTQEETLSLGISTSKASRMTKAKAATAGGFFDSYCGPLSGSEAIRADFSPHLERMDP